MTYSLLKYFGYITVTCIFVRLIQDVLLIQLVSQKINSKIWRFFR